MFYDTNMQSYVVKSYEKADEDKFMEEHRHYSETDKRMIKILYSKCITIGLKKKDFDEFLTAKSLK